jgi:hypothetical protein
MCPQRLVSVLYRFGVPSAGKRIRRWLFRHQMADFHHRASALSNNNQPVLFKASTGHVVLDIVEKQARNLKVLPYLAPSVALV